MNVTRMRAVRRAIKASEKVGKFEMCEPGYAGGNCGTRGCVAGHAAWLYTTPKQVRKLHDYFTVQNWKSVESWEYIGAFLLDLPVKTAQRLFVGRGTQRGVYSDANTMIKQIDQLIADRKQIGSYAGPVPSSPALRKLQHSPIVKALALRGKK